MAETSYAEQTTANRPHGHPIKRHSARHAEPSPPVPSRKTFMPIAHEAPFCSSK
ncbi:hypothetical protein GBA52_016663 [Prunus armeniaca]|nr:hypothetical protein GBA52_016663 [Prunus armeniaca]